MTWSLQLGLPLATRHYIKLTRTLLQAKQWAIKHPAAAVGIAVGAGMVVAPMAVAAPALGVMGLGSSGPVAGA